MIQQPPFDAAPTLAAQVMNYVRDAAQTGEMFPGQWYSVYKLSEELGISRSPVRDGLLRLQEAGLIEFSRNRGFQIVETRPSDVADIFDVRLALEPRAAARAARFCSAEQREHMQHALAKMAESLGDEQNFFAWDEQLHRAILEAGGSTRGREALDKLRTHTRILTDSTVRRQRSLRQVHSEHVPIVEAIAAGDEAAAAEAMTAHITATGKLLLSQTLAKQAPALSDAALAAEVEHIWQRHASAPVR